MAERAGRFMRRIGKGSLAGQDGLCRTRARQQG
jgi:hypothetical protein